MLPQNTSPGVCKLRIIPLGVPQAAGQASPESGPPLCASPPFLGPVPTLGGSVFAGKRPRAVAAPGIGCSVTTRKPGPGRSEASAAAAAAGVSLAGCSPPSLPKPPSYFPFQPQGFIVPLPASPSRPRSLFSADLFSSFCGETLLVSPRALFLS